MILGILYADLYNPRLATRATAAFRSALRVVTKRLADTTNDLLPKSRGNLYHILRLWLECGIDPSAITIITFNQDLQIEKMLHYIQGTRKWGARPIFNFPYCYCLPKYRITNPTSPGKLVFPIGNPRTTGIKVLKLHGSLNWHSKHLSRNPSPRSLFNRQRELFLTTRSTISKSLRVRGKRSLYSFPVVIPPVVHKAGILHGDLEPVWEAAYRALRKAKEIVVFGYSCPQADYESANLISRGVRHNKNRPIFSVIDPSPATFQRYVELTGLRHLRFSRGPEGFI